MREEQIECLVQLKIDHLDRRYMKNEIDSGTYDREMERIKDWADAEYRKISLAPFRMEA